MLDPGSLAVLGGHFERLMGAIQGRVEQVSLGACLLLPTQPPCFFFFHLLTELFSFSINEAFF